MALTGKKRIFADAILGGKSNKAAAIAAGYSAATASQAGSRLVKDKAVVAYLKDSRAAVARGEPPADARPTFDLAKALQHQDPKTFLVAAMNDIALAEKLRIDAAKALMPFMHQKLGEGSKKEQKEADAKKVASRFSTAAPPKLVAAGGKKV